MSLERANDPDLEQKLAAIRCSLARRDEKFGHTFAVHELLGEGGTSWVFRGETKSDDPYKQPFEPECAVKVAKTPSEIVNPQAQQFLAGHSDLLRRELLQAHAATFHELHSRIFRSQIGARVHHAAKLYDPSLSCFTSRIVDVRQCGITPDGRGYMEMEYIRTWRAAPTLDHYCARNMGLMTKREMLPLVQPRESGVFYGSPPVLPTKSYVAREILLAMKEFHDSGVLHRDFKPSNILLYHLCNEIHVKVCDLQTLVKLNERKEYFGPSHGSRYFCSPEQAYNASIEDAKRHGVPLHPSSDIYAIGCTMLCLVGKATREMLPDVEHKLDRGEFESIMQPLRNCVLPAYRAIATKATAFDAEERYQSADEMLDALNGVEADDDGR